MARVCCCTGYLTNPDGRCCMDLSDGAVYSQPSYVPNAEERVHELEDALAEERAARRILVCDLQRQFARIARYEQADIDRDLARSRAEEPCEFCGDGPCPHGCEEEMFRAALQNVQGVALNGTGEGLDTPTHRLARIDEIATEALAMTDAERLSPDSDSA